MYLEVVLAVRVQRRATCAATATTVNTRDSAVVRRPEMA
jgi:hypothetical protein